MKRVFVYQRLVLELLFLPDFGIIGYGDEGIALLRRVTCDALTDRQLVVTLVPKFMISFLVLLCLSLNLL